MVQLEPGKSDDILIDFSGSLPGKNNVTLGRLFRIFLNKLIQKPSVLGLGAVGPFHFHRYPPITGFHNPIDFRAVMIPPIVNRAFQIPAPEIPDQRKPDPLLEAGEPLFL